MSEHFVAGLARFVKLGRLQFLVAGFLLYSLGALFAVPVGAAFDVSRFLFGYAVLATGHLSVSYSNDYYDYDADLRAEKGLFSGGSRILIEHPGLRPAALWFSVLLIAASVLLAIAFAIIYSPPPAYLALAVFGNLLGWFYTAPPLRLAYRGLGEVATVVGVGFVVPGIGNITMCGSLTPQLLVFLAPLLCYALFFIVSVDIPDAATDKAAGKSTLVARLGTAPGFIIIALAALLASASLAITTLLPGLVHTGPALLFSLIPLLPGLYGSIARPTDRKRIERQIRANIGSLVALALLLDAYFTYIRF